MSWLLSEARVLASVDVAGTRTERAKGLLGRSTIDGAFAIPSCRWVHTVGMRFPIDVAYVDQRNVVIKTASMSRHRLALPVPKARMVIEARAGAFERWGLKVGDTLEIRVTDPDDEIGGHDHHRHGLHRHGADREHHIGPAPRDDERTHAPIAERPVADPRSVP